MRVVGGLVLLGVLVTGVLAINLLVFLYTPYGHSKELRVEPGMTLDDVTDRLSREGLLSNKALFRFYVNFTGKEEKIRAGDYHFTAPVTPKKILILLLQGDFLRARITIPEGWTARQIARYLGEKGFVEPDEFLAKVSDPDLVRSLGVHGPSLEGFLFPDTYELYPPKEAEEVVRRMAERFWEVYTPEMRRRAVEIGMSDYEIVTLASIVEKETGRAEERPLIASVFHNRLKGKIALASDPTVIYGIKDFSGNLRRVDLERPGPYNTYLNPGLPPTPIGSPGFDSLRAVLYPQETDYLYFVSKNDGSHHFSRTVTEHNRAVWRYQKSRAPQVEGKSPTVKTPPP